MALVLVFQEELFRWQRNGRVVCEFQSVGKRLFTEGACDAYCCLRVGGEGEWEQEGLL